MIHTNKQKSVTNPICIIDLETPCMFPVLFHVLDTSGNATLLSCQFDRGQCYIAISCNIGDHNLPDM